MSQKHATDEIGPSWLLTLHLLEGKLRVKNFKSDEAAKGIYVKERRALP
jgi:hypothetical protein